MIKLIPLGSILISLFILLSGCGMFSQSKKPEIGPAGTPVETKANPPFAQRFVSPPEELYNLEATAGVIFEGIIKNDWQQAERGLSTLKQQWLKAQALIGDKKGVTTGSEALVLLTTAITGEKTIESYENLNKFMASMGDIGKSYKLSPISDIIGIGNSIRTVSFYVDRSDWPKSLAKMKELDNTWGHAKPNLESVGILNQVTTTHSTVKQMKDAVDGENRDSFQQHVANINESMGYIREYYQGK